MSLSWRSVVVGGLLLISGQARAVPGLAWQWPDGEERRYLVSSVMQLAEPLQFMSLTNTRVRVNVVDTRVNVLCKPKPDAKPPKKPKTTWEVHCKVEDVAWKVAPATETDQGRILEIVDDFGQTIRKEEVYIQMIITAGGRVQTVNIQGIPTAQKRANMQRETMRTVMTRTFAALDLGFPKKGDDEGKPWNDNQSKVPAFPSMAGSQGSVAMVNKVESVDQTVVTISSTGRGTMGPADSTNLYDMTVTATGQFDTSHGLIVEREWKVVSVPTASSALAETGQATQTTQSGKAIYIPPGTQISPFGPNEELMVNFGGAPAPK
jgi:hypothetical protein